MIFNLVKLLAVASIALAAPSSPPLEGPVTARECKTYHYQDFCCMFSRLKSLASDNLRTSGRRRNHRQLQPDNRPVW